MWRIQETSNSEEQYDTSMHPRFSCNQTTATFNQAQIFNYNGGFVGMNMTKFALAHAFPTVFTPNYIQVSKNEWEWVILHDITGWRTHQDKGISFAKWREFMMCGSNSNPVSHPTFALLLGNHKIKCQLQQQGKYVLNTSNFGTTTTLVAIPNAAGNNAAL